MILGIGTDLVDIKRIEKLINSSDSFIQKIFTENEIEISEKYSDKKRKIAYFAKRFSAKESFSKALGTGFGENLSFKDIEILNDEKGQPYFNISNNTDNYIKNTYGVNSYEINLSLTDEYHYAQSFVIISR